MTATSMRWAALLALLLPAGAAAQSVARIGDLTFRPGDLPRRVVGYGLVVGLDGTGDRSFGTYAGGTMTVRSVVNLLRRFNIEVPPDRLRLRNVAAVLVTAELSPYLRSGGRFEVQVSAMGDATSLRGGVLWMTPLVENPNDPPVATAQGPLYVEGETVAYGPAARRGNSGRIIQGGLLEADPSPVAPAAELRLVLKDPNLGTATAIAEAVNRARGPGTARATDPGSVLLKPPGDLADTANVFLAALDTLPVPVSGPARVVINTREGTIAAGGGLTVGSGVVSHHGLTLEVGGAAGPAADGLVRVAPDATVQDIAAGLHAVGARPDEVAAIFEALRASGALRAEVVIR
ncbi:MAG: flagellar basal body P-ring protein FlgI [Gemmatimonadales bacterium]